MPALLMLTSKQHSERSPFSQRSSLRGKRIAPVQPLFQTSSRRWRTLNGKRLQQRQMKSRHRKSWHPLTRAHSISTGMCFSTAGTYSSTTGIYCSTTGSYSGTYSPGTKFFGISLNRPSSHIHKGTRFALHDTYYPSACTKRCYSATYPKCHGCG
jgi:hypothetical protein